MEEQTTTTAEGKSENAPPPNKDAPRAPEVSKIILPQKNAGPSVLSASRRPAGEALEAANAAPSQTGEASGVLERLKGIPATIANALPDVPALHTYKGDVAQSIQKHNISLTAMVQAQSKARAQETAGRTQVRSSRNIVLIAELMLGALFIIGAIGILAWLYERNRPVPGVSALQAPFIYVDQTKEVTIDPRQSPAASMSALMQTIQSVNLPVGLVEQVSLNLASTAPRVLTTMDTRSFFSDLVPQAPDSLIRSLSSQFLLGTYSFDGNRPFLIFKTDAYEQAFAGMLAWEYTLPKDLAPLFPYVPLTPTSTPENTAILKSPFTDAIVDNHDVRVLNGSAGNPELLWSFVDRQTLVITTNANTLGEIISRLQKAPTITVPR